MSATTTLRRSPNNWSAIVNRDFVDQHFSEEPQTSDPVADLERGLTFAEELQARIVEAESKILAFRFREVLYFFIGSFLTFVPSLLVKLLPDIATGTRLTISAVFALSALIALAYMLYAELIVRRIKRPTDADKRRLEDLIELMQETERAIVNTRNLSTLKREYLRIRLSRFGIGKKSWQA
jgi:hypothetical protein